MISTPSRRPSRTASGASRSTTTTSASASAWNPRRVGSSGSPGPPPTRTTRPPVPAGRRPAPSGSLPQHRLDGGDRGVAQGSGPARVPVAVDADGGATAAPGGRHPRRGRARVVDPEAEGALGVGLTDDRGVDLGVGRAGHRQPAFGQVPLGVDAPLPLQVPTLGQVLQGGHHLRRHHGDERVGREQGPHPAQGDRAATDHDHAPPGQAQPQRQQRLGLVHDGHRPSAGRRRCTVATSRTIRATAQVTGTRPVSRSPRPADRAAAPGRGRPG